MGKGLLNNVKYTENLLRKWNQGRLFFRFENLNFVRPIALLSDILQYLNNEKHC